MKIFILEDDPARIAGFESALGALSSEGKHEVTIRRWLSGPDGAFAAYLKNGPFDLLLLDHDLGGAVMVDSYEEETGSEFVRWLCREGEPQYIGDLATPPNIIIHSWNPDGARVMGTLFKDAGGETHSIKVPFGTQLLNYLKTL